MYILDTNHASLLFRQVPEVISAFQLRGSVELMLCTPSMGELWYMAHNSQQREKNLADMLAFIQQFNFLEYSPESAERFGSVKANLRRRGRMIPDVDIQIASVALVFDGIVLTSDAHFQQVENLRIENWLPTPPR